MSMNRLEGLTTYVTGAASGIGLATAKLFYQEGAKVVWVDRDEEKLVAALKSIDADANRTLMRVLDLRSAADVAQSVQSTVQHWGTLDAAVNCAGILGPVGKVHATEIEAYEELITANLHSVFYCMKAQLGQMVQQKSGSIVNIASAAGLVGFPMAAAYTASKHAIVGLTRTCAVDYALDGIRVNAIAPGGVDTPLIQSTTCATPEGRDMIVSLHPMKRLAQPVEIARAALFLVSSEASFVTGETLSVDGGWVAA